MHRNGHSFCPSCLAVAALLLIVLTPAAGAVTVSAFPADTTVVCGDTLTVRIVTDEFNDLKAYQLVFGFDPTVLQFIGAAAGDLLTAGTMQELPDVTAPLDSVWVDCAQLVGSVNGPGVLAYFRFLAMEQGVSPLTCLTVDFRDSWNVQTLPVCVGATTTVPKCPVPVLPSSWGSLKTIYR